MPRRRRLHVASPQPAARHSEPAQVFPANAAATDGRPRLDGVIGWCRIRAVAGGAADGRPSLSRFPPMEPGSGPRSTGRGHGRSARRCQRRADARLVIRQPALPTLVICCQRLSEIPFRVHLLTTGTSIGLLLLHAPAFRATIHPQNLGHVSLVTGSDVAEIALTVDDGLSARKYIKVVLQCDGVQPIKLLVRTRW
jgi:hypothetical protein